MDAAAPRARGLSTARAALQLLALLARSPHGLRADEAARALGKSVSTAYNLLDSLCEEGFAVHGARGHYRFAIPAEAPALAARVASLVGPGDAGGLPATPLAQHRASRPLAGLVTVLDELFARSHKRAYLAVAHAGRIVIPLVRGRQGIRRIPGLDGEIGPNAHALALGKVALALHDAPTLERYVGDGLRAFTPHTIVDPRVLYDQLDEIRRDGVAADREEFGRDVCCVAAPVFNARREAVAILGISMSARSFSLEGEELAGLLREVAERAGAALPAPSFPTIPEESGRSCLPAPSGRTVAAQIPETEVSA